jgi:hypothetical protein
MAKSEYSTKKRARYTPNDPPGDFVVFLNFSEKSEVSRMRLGGYGSLAEAQKAIRDNEVGRRQTFGGLIESAHSATGPVTYAIWQATGWQKIA